MYIEGVMTLEEQDEFAELGWELGQTYPITNPEIVRVYVETFSMAEVLNLLTQIEDEEMAEEDDPEVEGQ